MPTHMDFFPTRRLGLLFGSALLFAALGLTLVGLYFLATSEISPWLILWVILPLLGAPAAALISYQLYGLLTARYRMDREGIRVTWGLAEEQIPIGAIEEVHQVDEVRLPRRPGKGPWWPGCVTGHKQVEGWGEVEFFGTDLSAGATIIQTGGRKLAITPGNPGEFKAHYGEALRSGPLEPVPAISQRPDRFISQIWSDLPARWLILTGLILPLSLLTFLSITSPHLPGAVPFGFGPGGEATTLAPGGRLLLLPMIGGFVWAVDLFIGSWLFRKEPHTLLAYMLWAVGAIVGALFWGASLHLLAAA
jgi:hypothetical protein